MRQLQLDIEPQLDARISDFSGPGWGPVVDAIRQLHTGLVNRFYVMVVLELVKAIYSLQFAIHIWN